jgi:aquaporin NIP
MVFIGCGAIINAELNNGYGTEFISIAFGAVVAVMIYSVGHISGAHFNPAVTLAFWSLKKINFKKVMGYLSAQFTGAFAASYLHLIIWGSTHQFGMTEFSVSLSVGLLMEVLISFLLMFVITSVATDSRAVGELAGIAIGSTVAICAFVAGPLTGASMNPARSFGPAIFSNQLSILWPYILAPIIGAFLGAQVYAWIKRYRDDEMDQDHS